MSDLYQIVTKESFKTELEDIHNHVFECRLLNHDDLSSTPFVPDWNTLLFPFGVGRTNREFFRSLSDATSVCGDERMHILDAESVEPDPEQVGVTLLDVTFEAFRAGLNEEMYHLAHIDTHIFGCSGEWGVVGAESLDGILYAAGRPDFLHCLLKEIGGERRLMEQMKKFSMNGWRIGPELKRQILSSVGWDEDLPV